MISIEAGLKGRKQHKCANLGLQSPARSNIEGQCKLVTRFLLMWVDIVGHGWVDINWDYV